MSLIVTSSYALNKINSISAEEKGEDFDFLDDGFVDNLDSPLRNDLEEAQNLSPALSAIASANRLDIASFPHHPTAVSVGNFGRESLDRGFEEEAHQNSDEKPTSPKTDSSGCFGITLSSIFDAEGIAEKIPAWISYKIFDRSLNEQHKKIYGNQQEIYLEETQKSVEYTLMAMSKLRESHTGAFGDCFFRELLSTLGSRRMETARLCSTNLWFFFGEKRFRDLYTPVGDHYQAYETRVISELQDVQLKVALGFGERLLTYYLPPRAANELSSGRPALINHHYTTFWNEGDALFLHAEALCRKIILSHYATAEDLGKDVADLHWILANAVPFKRGTASILETLTDALWLLHGYIPGHVEQGKSLDLEALTNKREVFQKTYPLGTKPS